ncbi:sialoadhesin-like isoform X3 [Simochromis diagramma]|uniref:sialoadhesin-like isoform X3 n=1 Tax=Simochromis diagramma TaxID=43689 RepID=UPI001A7E9C03|nr:sialoadhesin-like isoform X3 [Simochromis diagramma]
MFQEGANFYQDVVATFATKRSVKLQRADAMKAILLLLLLSTCRTSAQSRASLKVTPNWSQFFEYEHISLSCERIASGEWTVWRSPAKKGLKVSDCTSGWGIQTSSTCEIKRVTHSDSGVYWCQSTHGHSSNAISITVNGLENPVILLSPAAPVVEGENVTLLCRTKNPSNLPANFFKDDHPIKSETANHTTIYQASKADQGSYKCHISGHGESPSSWLLIQDHSDLPTLTPSPNSAQMFEYKDLNLSCGIQGWTVKRFSTFDKQVSGCEVVWGKATSYGCILHKIKGLDSAVYWCESPTHQRSNSVNITVYEREYTPVILQSPVLPVMKGANVTLLCESKNSQSDIPATFYKNESIIGTGPRSHMIIYNVTKSHEGMYKCNMSVGVSPSSWLFIIDPDAPTSDPHKNLSSLGILRYILVYFPYVISTFLMASIYRMSAGRSSHVSITMPPPTEEDEDQSYDDVMADVTTEHNF